MAELLGLPHADATNLQHMIAEVANLNIGLGLSDADFERTHQVGLELDAYLRTALGLTDGIDLGESPSLGSSTQNPGVLGRIALDTSETITDDDRVSLAFILLAAGFETTAMLVANALHLLIEHPVEWKKLASDPDRSKQVIEEALRLQAPAAFTTRFVSTPTTVAGQALAPGTSVAMFLAAANRDPAKYANPAAFNPSRFDDSNATPPLSFGSGMHHCLGSVLARSEAAAVLRRLDSLGRLETLSLVEPVSWRPSLALRGVETLIVRRSLSNPADAKALSLGSSKLSATNTGISPTNVLVGKDRRRAHNKMRFSLVAGFLESRVKTVFMRGARKQEAREAYTAEAAAKAVEVMGDLKGVTMKLGQMASFLAPTMGDAAKRSLIALQSSAPAMAQGQAELAILRALGKPVNELFAEWSPIPVAAASIGQVHRARLHDGRSVAVKVQYPGIADAMKSDLKDTAKINKLTQRFAFRNLDADRLSIDLAERVSQELDYRIEANHQRDFAKRFADHPFVHIPKVIDELSTDTVLVSEWADGQDWATFLSDATQAEKDRAGEIIARFMFACTRRYRHFNADPNPGNMIISPGANRITFIDFGLAKRVTVQQDEKMWVLTDAIMDRLSASEISQRSIDLGYLPANHGLEPRLTQAVLRQQHRIPHPAPLYGHAEMVCAHHESHLYVRRRLYSHSFKAQHRSRLLPPRSGVLRGTRHLGRVGSHGRLGPNRERIPPGRPTFIPARRTRSSLA
jgi:predicted unusual protein kinase regulating ubiquinone biosynthesis (AarF/ABC1/UbiB family)